MMATMRRVPSEQFFDLRGWQADHAEEYGEQPSMRVQTLQLDRPEQVGSITSELHDGNLVLVDYTPLEGDQSTLHKVLAERERAVADVDGDICGVARHWLVVAPRGVRVARKRLGD